MSQKYPKWYTKPREKWDAEKCRRVSRKRWRDGLGTPGPLGLVVCNSASYPKYGRMRFNGGIVIDDVWYTEGTDIPWPELAPGFAWYHLVSWGMACLPDTTIETLSVRKIKLDKDGRII